MKLHFYLVSLILASCASAPPLPQLSSYELRAAQVEISTSSLRDFKPIAQNEASTKAVEIANRLTTWRQKCLELADISQNRCNGKFEIGINPSNEFNAYAYGKNQVALNSGLVGYLKNDSEWAFVIAHELAHHFADHIGENRRSGYVGELIGGAITAGIYAGIAGAAGVQCDPSYQNCDYLENYVRDGWESGAAAGREIAIARYSREQEVEADAIAAELLRDAGYEVSDAQGIIAFMGGMSGSRSSSKFGDSHPSGPERLAQFYKIAARFSATSALGRAQDAYKPEEHIEAPSVRTEEAAHRPDKKSKFDAYWLDEFGLQLSNQSLEVLEVEEDSKAESIGLFRGLRITKVIVGECPPSREQEVWFPARIKTLHLWGDQKSVHTFLVEAKTNEASALPLRLSLCPSKEKVTTQPSLSDASKASEAAKSRSRAPNEVKEESVSIPSLGLTLASAGSLRIIRVRNESVGEDLGLRAGDKILRARHGFWNDWSDLSSYSDLRELIKKIGAHKIKAFSVTRDRKPYPVEVGNCILYKCQSLYGY